MTHPVPEWAGTAVAWDPEVPGLDPVGTVPDAGSWSVPFSDFSPVSDPIAMELRAESISQLIHGDALRCGEAECIESTGSSTGADLVAGRDRVRVHGRLREHTGGELAAMVTHLDTSVGGSLEVHAEQDDTVLLAGHMSESWNGGAAVVAAVADDLAAGGGVRVTMPLDLWVHGVMGVEERAATCTADVAVVELAATHYEREYNAGVHMARLARFAGAMHVTAKTGFFPLMEVSCGVRNLIAGAGEGGSAPASPTPPPSTEGTGTTASAATLARDTARAGEGAAEVGVRGHDATDFRHASALPESELGEDLGSLRQLVLELEELLASGDEFEDIARSTDELSELNHSADSAEQLASLRYGESVRPEGAMTAGPRQALDEHLSAIDMRVAEAMDEPATTGRADEAADPDWNVNFRRLLDGSDPGGHPGDEDAADAYQAAAEAIADHVLAAYYRFGGDVDALSPDHATDVERAQEAYTHLRRMITETDLVEDVARSSEIRAALEEIDGLTNRYVVDLGNMFGETTSQGSDTPFRDATWDTWVPPRAPRAARTGRCRRYRLTMSTTRTECRSPPASMSPIRREGCSSTPMRILAAGTRGYQAPANTARAPYPRGRTTAWVGSASPGSGSPNFPRRGGNPKRRRGSVARRLRIPSRPPLSPKVGMPRRLPDSDDNPRTRPICRCHAGRHLSTRSNEAQ